MLAGWLARVSQFHPRHQFSKWSGVRYLCAVIVALNQPPDSGLRADTRISTTHFGVFAAVLVCITHDRQTVEFPAGSSTIPNTHAPRGQRRNNNTHYTRTHARRSRNFVYRISQIITDAANFWGRRAALACLKSDTRHRPPPPPSPPPRSPSINLITNAGLKCRHARSHANVARKAVQTLRNYGGNAWRVVAGERQA